MAVLDGHYAAADPDDPVGSGLGKLIDSLPASTARQASLVRNHARATPDRRAVRPRPAIIAAVVEAVAHQRTARIDYTTGSGTSMEKRIEPWAIVVPFRIVDSLELETAVSRLAHRLAPPP